MPIVSKRTEPSESRRFLRLLTHDDWSSRYIVARKRGDVWSENAYDRDSLLALDLESRREENVYVSVNGFTGRCRRSNRTRQINAMVFDLDVHEPDEGRTYASAIASLVGSVQNAVLAGSMPPPTAIVSTGRGLQIHYVLEHSLPYRLKKSSGAAVNNKALEYYSDVRNRLAAVLDEVCGEVPGAANDRSVFDLSRVVRVPGTYNSQSSTSCRLLEIDESRLYSLFDLKAATSTPQGPAQQTGCPSRQARILKYDKLLLHRAKKLVELRDLRESGRGSKRCEGHSRNNLLFVYYNTCTQIYDIETARTLARSYNQGFGKPLEQSEVDSIISSVDRNGPYRISAGTLTVKFLRADRAELEAVRFFGTSRAIERAAAKQETAQRRSERNALVLELLKAGLTQGETAKVVGISRATVNSISQASLPRRKDLKELAARALERRASENGLSNFLAHVLGCVGSEGVCSDWPAVLRSLCAHLGPHGSRKQRDVSCLVRAG